MTQRIDNARLVYERSLERIEDSLEDIRTALSWAGDYKDALENRIMELENELLEAKAGEI